MALVDDGQPDRSVQSVRIHGHDRAYLKVGSGPALLLIHGIGSRHETWWPVIDELARTHTVIAPDLLGHGQSGKPRADYSIGGYANGMRDLLTVLGIDRVTVVGHSLGGGVAMQFAYQFPQRTERIVLVGTGGLGAEVNPIIPLCTVPGSSLVLSGLVSRPVRRVGLPLLNTLHKSGLPMTADLDQLGIVYNDLGSRDARKAFRHVLRAIVDWRGQIVTMNDRAYLTEFIPTLLIWGRDDTVIPVKHAYAAEERLPHAEIKVFNNAGHFPHADQPELFVQTLLHFLAEQRPARFDPRRWNRVMKQSARNVFETLPDQDELIDVRVAGSVEVR
ncbi:MAG: alpha/beta fold hydrolase [Candidatus Nanopelagicales bacterium]